MTDPVECPADVAALLASNAPVAVGVSGGKDSVACALAVAEYLRRIGHTGPKVLIHSDLGLVEWADSAPACERLAAHLQARYEGAWTLHTTRRAAGGMMERWEGRWAANVKRYRELSCVKLILPWSTPSMRFCTSELKSAPIASALKKLFGKQPILSVTGIRAEESANRAKMPASKVNKRLPAGSLDWNPIIRWKLADVFGHIANNGILLHEAYRLFGASRVSCAFCIMSAGDDLLAALKDPRNLPLFERMSALELESGYAFQGGKWLSDLRPEGRAAQTLRAKELAALRESIERTIPAHLLFEKGWPNFVPTHAEAALIADVRARVCQAYGWTPTFTTADAVVARYEALLAAKPGE